MDHPGPGPPTKRRRRAPIPSAPISGHASILTSISPLSVPPIASSTFGHFPNGLEPIPATFKVDQTTTNTQRWLDALPNLRLRSESEQPMLPPAVPGSIGSAVADETAGPISEPALVQADDVSAAPGPSDPVINEEDDDPLDRVYNWEDAPVVDSRAFVVIEVKLVPGKRKLKGVAPKDVEHLDFWLIKVHNHSVDDSPILEVYGPGEGKKKVNSKGDMFTGGALDTSICADEQSARQLGACVCRLLDRLPYILDSTTWHHWVPNRQSYSTQRFLVEARALDIWQPSFDRARLFEPHRHLDLNMGPIANSDVAFSDVDFCKSIMYLCSGNGTRNFLNKKYPATHIAVKISIGLIDTEKLDALTPVSADFAYLLQEVKFTEKQKPVVLKAFQRLQAAMSFKVGTPTGMQRLYRTEIAKFTKDDLRGRSFVGKAHKNSSKRDVLWTVRNFTRLGAGEFEIRPNSNIAALIEGKLPTMYVRCHTMKMVAYVLNQMLSAAEVKRVNLIQMWQVGILASDDISTGRVTSNQVNDRHCNCEISLDAHTTAHHVCMVCLDRVPCSSLVVATDGRRICVRCSQVTSNLHGDVPVGRSIARVLSRLAQSVKAVYKRHAPRDRVQSWLGPFETKLADSIVDYMTDQWQDMYGGVRSLADTEYPGAHGLRTDRGTVASHPLQPSCDNIDPLTFVDGRGAWHDAENVGLTLLGLNYVKHEYVVAILPTLAAAAQQTKREEDGENKDEQIWNDFHNNMDRIHYLGRQIPRNVAAQLALTERDVDQDVLAEFLAASRSLEWHSAPPSPISVSKPRISFTSADTVSDFRIQHGKSLSHGLAAMRKRNQKAVSTKLKAPIWLEWSDKEKRQLLVLVDEMENDETINSQGLKVPRNEQRVPWPFREAHVF